jgi:hypothetical protein
MVSNNVLHPTESITYVKGICLGFVWGGINANSAFVAEVVHMMVSDMS